MHTLKLNLILIKLNFKTILWSFRQIGYAIVNIICIVIVLIVFKLIIHKYTNHAKNANI